MKVANPRRIAIMLPRFSRYGGVEQFGYRISEALASRGHEVDFICSRQEIKPPEGVRLICLKRIGGFKFLKMLWFLIGAEVLRRSGKYDYSLSLGKTWNQDLIRCGGGPLRNFWAKSEKALSLGWSRNFKRFRRLFSPANWLTLAIEKHQYNEKTQVIAVSHLVKEWLMQEHPNLRDENIEVIYNRPNKLRFSPVNPEERAVLRKAFWEKHAGQAYKRHKGHESLYFMGTATTNFKLKGIGPFIESMTDLPEKLHFFVAGGRGNKKYMKLASDLGLEDRVHFCGKVDDMPDFYRCLDLFVLASFYDACSNAVLEALSSGCPALSTIHNGSSYFLPAEELILNPGDPDELAAAIGKAMTSKGRVDFLWPEDLKSGIGAFVESMEKRMEA